MVRLLGIVLNLSLIGVLIFLIADSGMPTRGGQIALVVLLVVTPLLNLGFLISRAGNSDGKGLLSLYLQRKALEERKKITELQG